MSGKVPLPRVSSSIRELTHITNSLLSPQVSSEAAWENLSGYPLRNNMRTEMGQAGDIETARDVVSSSRSRARQGKDSSSPFHSPP